MNKFGSHLRHIVRQVARNPWFFFITVFTLALGMGANTAIFSIYNAVLLKELPLAHPEEIVRLHTTGDPDGAGNSGNTTDSFSWLVFSELRNNNQALSTLVAYAPLSFDKVPVRVGANSGEATVHLVTGNFFSALQVSIPYGTGLSDEDEKSHETVAVLSYKYWKAKFSADRSVIGSVINIQGKPFVIRGIASRSFFGVDSGDDTDIWIPFQNQPVFNPWGNTSLGNQSFYDASKWWCVQIAGRLRPGVSLSSAASHMQPIFHSAAYRGLTAPKSNDEIPQLYLSKVHGMQDYGQIYAASLSILLGMVGVVLLIAGGNVSMLMLARYTARQGEFSLRSALGAPPKNIFGLLFSELTALVIAASGCSWILAIIIIRLVGHWMDLEDQVAPDSKVFLFSIGILITCLLLFGLLPLRRVLTVQPNAVLKNSSAPGGPSAGSNGKLEKTVVIFQIALSLALVNCAGLLYKTISNLESLPLGMDAKKLLVFSVRAQPGSENTETVTFFASIVDRLEGLPGIESVTLLQNRLGAGIADNSGVLVDGHVPVNAVNGAGPVRSNFVGPHFFETLRIPILMGRDIASADTAGHGLVVVVNRTFAERYLPNESAIGHHIGGKLPGQQATIIGVAENSKYIGIDEDALPMAWMPYMQAGILQKMNVEIRTRGNPLDLLPTATTALSQISPNLIVENPATQVAQFGQSISNERLAAQLSALFGVLAVLLVVTGLYGVLSYRVALRSKEVGIRMATGASRGKICWLFLKEGIMLCGWGILAGVPPALFAGYLLRSTLFGVTPYDQFALMMAIMLILATSAVASCIPAIRASLIDPAQLLRSS
jgi:predicted permease